MEFKNGMKFTSKHFKGHIEVLAVLETENVLKVRSVRRFDRYHEEDWNLEHTIVGFQRGDYSFSADIVSNFKVYQGTLGCETTGLDVMISINVCHPASDVQDYYFTKSQIEDLKQILDRLEFQ